MSKDTKEIIPLRLEFLSRLRREGDVGTIYYNLFVMIDPPVLEEVLQAYYEISVGNDSYFKESGKTEWFTAFHKSIRNADFYLDFFTKRNVNLLTEDERKEMRFLRNKVSEPTYVKYLNEPTSFTRFTPEYNRYLDLVNKKRREQIDYQICGNLDMVLWHMVHVDHKMVLQTTLEALFMDYEDELIS